VEHLGFLDFGQEGWTHMVRGGEPQALSDATNYSFLAKAMIAEGLLTREQVDSVLRLYVDPAFNFPGLTMFSAWGRKPLQVT
jgi:hypothetical protein